MFNLSETPFGSLVFRPRFSGKPNKYAKAKGADIALAKDVLSNAYFDNYDIALPYTDDGDYMALVQEVKRLGKLVYTLLSEKWTNDELRLTSDGFVDTEGVLLESWRTGSMQRSLGLWVSVLARN